MNDTTSTPVLQAGYAVVPITALEVPLPNALVAALLQRSAETGAPLPWLVGRMLRVALSLPPDFDAKDVEQIFDDETLQALAALVPGRRLVATYQTPGTAPGGHPAPPVEIARDSVGRLH